MWDANDPINFDPNRIDFFSLQNYGDSQAPFPPLGQAAWWNSPLLPAQGFIEETENVETDNFHPTYGVGQGLITGPVSNSFDLEESRTLNVTLESPPIDGDSLFSDNLTPGTDSSGWTGVTSPIWTPRTPVTPEERDPKTQINIFIQATPERPVKRKRRGEQLPKTKNKRQRGHTARKDVMHNDVVSYLVCAV